MNDLRNDTDLVVDYAECQGFVDELSKLKKGVSEANGEMRNRLKQILEEGSFNAKAMAIIRELDGMSDSKRADVLRSFKPLFLAFWENKWSEAQADLLAELDGGQE